MFCVFGVTSPFGVPCPSPLLILAWPARTSSPLVSVRSTTCSVFGESSCSQMDFRFLFWASFPSTSSSFPLILSHHDRMVAMPPRMLLIASSSSCRALEVSVQSWLIGEGPKLATRGEVNGSRSKFFSRNRSVGLYPKNHHKPSNLGYERVAMDKLSPCEKP